MRDQLWKVAVPMMVLEAGSLGAGWEMVMWGFEEKTEPEFWSIW